MHKTATIIARIDPSLKNRAEAILFKTGLSSAEAIRLFYVHVCLNEGIPFEIKIPNKTTQKAMRDADSGKTKSVKNLKELLKEIL